MATTVIDSAQIQLNRLYLESEQAHHTGASTAEGPSVLQRVAEIINRVFRPTGVDVLERPIEFKPSPLVVLVESYEKWRASDFQHPWSEYHFRQAIDLLSDADRSLFVDLFFQRFFTEEDHDALILAKYPEVFTAILDEDAKRAMLQTMRQTLSLSLEEKAAWMKAHLASDPVFEIDDFLRSKFSALDISQKDEVNNLIQELSRQEGVEGPIAPVDVRVGNRIWQMRFALAWNWHEENHRKLALEGVSRDLLGRFRPLDQLLLARSAILEPIRAGGAEELNPLQVQVLCDRAEFLAMLMDAKAALCSKHPEFEAIFSDSSHPLFALWKEKEMFALFHPCPANENQREADLHKMQRISLGIASVLVTEQSAKDTEILLTVLLKQNTSHPRQDQIQGAVDLRNIQISGKKAALRGRIQPSWESRCKSVFTVPPESGEGVIAKYKPNHRSIVAREVAGYEIDSLMGLGMTPPTGIAQFSLKQSLIHLKMQFEKVEWHGRRHHAALERAEERHQKKELAESEGRADEALLEKDLKLESRLRAKQEAELAADNHRVAMDLCSQLGPILPYLYESLRIRYSQEANGHDLFWGIGCFVTDHYRALAIADFLESPAYIEFLQSSEFEKTAEKGSIQKWVNPEHGSIKRVIDFLLSDSEAGAILKNEIPESLVQLYCILGILKASQDGFSGNAFIYQNDTKWLYEFDDEASLPTSHEYWKVRMWQFGLPQADTPFSSPILQLFSNPDMLARLGNYAQTKQGSEISPESWDRQRERVEKMIQLFQMELAKATPTLAPRDLFFEVFGGREDYSEGCKRGFNPWHIFEYCLGEYGRGAYFNEDGCDRTILHRNLEVLYS